MIEENSLPLIHCNDISYRQYCINYFITQNKTIPSTHYFKIKYKNQEFLEKLKEVVNYKFIRFSNLYKDGKISEYREAFLEIDHNIYIQIEQPDTNPTEYGYTLFKKKKSEDSNTEYIIIYFCEQSRKSVVENIKNLILSLTPLKEETKNLINIVIQQHGELCLREFEIKRPKLNLNYNYNDDFFSIHKIIVDAINKKDADGLVLLYGSPGTGKTNYIKFLITKIKKKVIYLPPNLANEISSPSFINFLAENQNSVLIIEDAENILKSRQSGENQGVSNLLNVSNGLLSDILKVQIIATFNCDIKEVDTALLRQGRLIAKYKFEELSVKKGQELSDKLGFSTIIDRKMTVTEIYNQRQKDFREPKRKSIGF